MLRLVLGSLIAAVVTFVLGFVFFATPISDQGYKLASPEVQASVHEALKALPETGTYFIPYGEDAASAALSRQGTAMVQINKNGVSNMMDWRVFLHGFLHMFVAFLFLGFFLWMLRGSLPSFTSRILPVILLAAVAVIWTRLGQPIWFHTDWRNALYLAATDFISLVAGGLVLSAFIPRPSRR